MRLTEIIKKNAMAIAAMVIAIGSLTVMSFESKENIEVRDNHWFHVVDNEITTYYGNTPPDLCSETIPLDDPCIARLSDSQVDNPNSSSPNALISNPDHALERRYKDE